MKLLANMAAIVVVAAGGLLTGRVLHARLAPAPGGSSGPPLYVAVRATPASSAGSIAGRIRSSNGTFVAGARVCASEVRSMAIDSPQVFCADTDESGRYAITHLASARYSLAASAGGFRLASSEPASLVVGPVKPGESAGETDLTLEAGGALLEGTVLDARGGPLPGATVRATLTTSSRRPIIVPTDPDGRFRIWTLAGPVLLRFEAPGYASASVMPTAPTADVVVRLTQGATARGKVVSALDGRPLAQALVRAVPTGSWASPGHPSSLSGDDGSFAIEGLAPGTYTFAAEGDGWRGESIDGRVIGLAERVGDIAVPSWRVTNVEGTVSSLAGPDACAAGAVSLGPVAAGQASIDAPAGTPAETRTSRVPTMIASVEEGGRVRFRAVPAGVYRVTVHCPEEVLRDGPRTIEVGPANMDGVAWTVGRGGGIRVRVTDAKERPVPGAAFRVVWPRTDGSDARTVMPLNADGDGRYDLLGILFPGTYGIEATGGHSESSTIAVGEGSALVDATLRLAGASAIVVHVKTAAGAAVDGVVVSAVDGDRLVQGVALGDGRFQLGPLERGAYDVEIFDGVNPPVNAAGAPGKTIAVDGQRDFEQTVTVDRRESIRGRVVDTSGASAAGVCVTAACGMDDEGHLSLQLRQLLLHLDQNRQRVVTRSDGTFELEGLAPAARCRVRAERPGGTTGFAADVTSGANGAVVTLPAPGAQATATATPR